MAPHEAQWGPAITVLLVGLVLGVVLAVWARRRGRTDPPAPQAAPLPLRDLDGRLEALLQQLRELEDTAAKRTPGQLARERYALEVEAAQVLLAREGLSPAAEPAGEAAPPAPAGFLAARPALRGFLWGVSSVAALALLAFYAWRGTEPRREGGSLTGDATEGRPEAAVDVEARLDLARSLLARQDLMGVWNETQAVLAKVPGQPRALSYQAFVRLAMGQGDVAVEMLERARESAPDIVEAHQGLVYAYASLGRTKEAEAALLEAERLFPGIREGMREALTQLQEGGGPGAQAPPGAENPHAEVPPPPAEGPASESMAAAAAIGSVSGVIEAGPSVLGRIAPGSVVYVIVREAGVEQGPPAAAKRLAATGFPLEFFVGPADSMMGQPLPERMRIEARADADGDPATRPPSDPQAAVDGVATGARDLRLELR